MLGAVLYGPRDVRFEERPAPTIIEPTDAIIAVSATCVCGSDLWVSRFQSCHGPVPMGHDRNRRGGVGTRARPVHRVYGWTPAAVTSSSKPMPHPSGRASEESPARTYDEPKAIRRALNESVEP